MSFDAREISEYEGEPQELYWFMRGAEEWLYTSGAYAITLGLQTYEPLGGLKRQAIVRGQDRSRNQLSIDLPRTATIVSEFLGVPKQSPIWLKIMRVHEGETDDRITYQGRVRACDIKGSMATLTLDDIMASVYRQAFRHKFQNQCNHFLYDSNCTLVEGDYTHTGQTLLTVTNDQITVNNAEAAGAFINGQVRLASGERRLIIANTKVGSTHTLTLLQPFEGLLAGDVVSLIEGACRNTFATCPPSNQTNYGGYPLVPRKNPFKSVI